MELVELDPVTQESLAGVSVVNMKERNSLQLSAPAGL
jgi:hypothetical protein